MFADLLNVFCDHFFENVEIGQKNKNPKFDTNVSTGCRLNTPPLGEGGERVDRVKFTPLMSHLVVFSV